MKKNETIWDAYPKTTEHFRQTVAQAVEAQMRKPEDEEVQIKQGGKAEAQIKQPRNAEVKMGQTRKTGRVSSQKNIRRVKFRYLFPAAALLAAGGAVAAANNNELMKYLTSWKHLTESEAEAVIQTDVKQKTTELVGAEFAGQKTIDQDWSEPLLTVKEAYFDGTELRFIAEASDEGKKYELSMKEHVYINGEDAALSTGLYEVEDQPGTYFGGAEIRDMSYLESQIAQDSVEVRMTVLAFPAYEGAPFYTWKDEEAYEQIYKTGEFTYEDGMAYYVVPWEKEITSYTPQALTVEMALPEGVTEISEYQEACVVSQSGEWMEETEEELDGTNVTEARSFENQEQLSGSSATENQGQLPDGSAADYMEQSLDGSAADNMEQSPDGSIVDDMEQSFDGTDANYMEQSWGSEGAGNTESELGSDADHAEKVSENTSHVKCELEGMEGMLSIDAEIIQEKDQVYTGKLRWADFPVDKMASLYQEGNMDEWVKESEEYGSVHWQYQDKRIFASGGRDASYANDEELRYENAYRTSEILSKLGIDGRLELQEEKEEQGKIRRDYRVRWLLNGIPAAMESQIFCNGLMITYDDIMTNFQWSGSFEITSNEEAVLLPMDQVLEKLAGYLKEGELTPPYSGQPVTEIALEYYVDMTSEGIVFRPVWNFQVPYLVSEEHHIFMNNDMYCYIDAVTGALIRDAYGW